MSIIEMIKRTPESRKELEDAKKDSRTIVFASAGVCLLAAIGFNAIPSGFVQGLCAIAAILSLVAAIYFGSYRSKLKTLKSLSFTDFCCYKCGMVYDFEDFHEVEELKNSDGSISHLIEISFKCKKCGYRETVKMMLPHEVPSIENPTTEDRIVYAMKQEAFENGL